MSFQALMLLVLCMIITRAEAHVPSPPQNDEADCDFNITEYNLPLAVASIFILLGVSLVGSFSPLLLSIVQHRVVTLLIKVGSFAGSGVILATALVHCLLPANEYLANPCLPEGWHSYEPMAFMLCTATIVFFQILDFYLGAVVSRFAAQRDRRHPDNSPDTCCHASAAPVAEEACVKHPNCHDMECGGRALLASGGLKGADLSKIVAVLLAEGAIVLHSVIIGVALGVTSADEFSTLLTALCFHQFLEGFALGSAVVDAGCGRAKAYLLALLYSLSTPLGIAIGIGVRQSFNSNAVGTLISQGVLDSACAGILVYVVLSGPMNAVTSSSSWLQQQGWAVQLVCFAAFVAGAGAMAVIGKWA